MIICSYTHNTTVTCETQGDKTNRLLSLYSDFFKRVETKPGSRLLWYLTPAKTRLLRRYAPRNDEIIVILKLIDETSSLFHQLETSFLITQDDKYLE